MVALYEVEPWSEVALTTVVKSVFAVMRRSGADTIWGCPMTDTPTATLRLAVAWSHKQKPSANKQAIFTLA